MLRTLGAAYVAAILFASTVTWAIESEGKSGYGGDKALPPAAQTYHEYCSVCHGDQGDGQSRARNGLNPSPKDFTQQGIAATLTRQQMVLSVTNGVKGSAMAPWGSQLTAPQIEAVVDYIRSNFMYLPELEVGDAFKWDDAVKKALSSAIATDKLELARGRGIYADNCSVCHGDQGVGAKWTRSTLNPPPRNFRSSLAAVELTRERMLQAVIAGREGTAMVSYLGGLSISDIIVVVDYIRSEFMRIGSDVKGSHHRANMNQNPQYSHELQDSINMELPFADSLEGDVAAGRMLYLNNCAACHGVEGDGQGNRRSASQPLPRNFLSEESRTILNRPALYKGVSEGRRGTVMPAWARVFTEQQMADVSEFVFQTFIYPKAHVSTVKKKVVPH